MKQIDKKRDKYCKNDLLTATDLFAGGGGLSVGLKRAGFSVIAAVECETHAFSTYKANHPEVHAYKQDIRTIKGSDLLKHSDNNRIDLLSGCPPCQGFSSLTSKNKKTDPRNNLVKVMARLVEEIKPRAIMMENVPGITKKGNYLLQEFLELLAKLGYIVSYDILQVADYGIPQKRRRFVLLGGLNFKICIPQKTHSRVPTDGSKKWVSVKSAIGNMPNPITIANANNRGGARVFNWHVVRDLSAINLSRIKQAKPGKSWCSIQEELRPKCHKDISSGFSNVYGRMEWDEPSPTITGGCTTLSKGRFGHPEKNRTISVREAAILQTFPMDYIIDTPYMEYAANIVGNALPCDFAEILAVQCRKAIRKKITTCEKNNLKSQKENERGHEIR